MTHPSTLNAAFVAIGLQYPKTAVNVGSVLRAAGCFGVSLVATTGQRYTRAPTDTSAVYRSIPLIQVADLQEVIPFDCVPVAIELAPNARSLVTYTHPARAFYIFGPEDSSLGKEVLRWCRDVIQIPTNGCLNLAAAVNIVLYDRLAKAACIASRHRATT